MILNHFLCSDFCGFIKRHCFFIPRCSDQTNAIFILITFCFRNDIANTVYQTNIDCKTVVKFNTGRVIRYKFRFGCHDGFTYAGLWQFIHHARFLIFIIYIRNDSFFHKAFDERRFTNTNRTYDT